MGVLNRIAAIIVMSVIGWFVIGVTVSLVPIAAAVTSDTGGDKWWVMTIGPVSAVVITLIIGASAPTARIAWGRLFLLNGLVSLAAPLAGIAYSAIMAKHITEQTHSSAAATGAGIGGVLITGALGFVGFFLAAIFLVISFLALRGAPRSQGTPLAPNRM